MSIATALQNAQAKVAAAYSKCNDKGATMPATQDLAHLDDCIDSIPTGTAPNLQTLNVTPSTSAQQITPTSPVDGYDEVNVAAVTSAIDPNIVAGNIKKDVSILGVTGTYEGSRESPTPGDINFWDFDGTLVEVWSLSELAGKTELPAQPVHQGLTNQGWNWTLAELKTQNSKMDVGALSTTTDGKCRMHIFIPDYAPDSEKLIRMRVNGHFSIDWGDGTVEEKNNLNQIFSHTYTNKGNHVIEITKLSGDVVNFAFGAVAVFADDYSIRMLTEVEIDGSNFVCAMSTFKNASKLCRVNYPNGNTFVSYSGVFDGASILPIFIAPRVQSLTLNFGVIGATNVSLFILSASPTTISVTGGCAQRAKRFCVPDSVTGFADRVCSSSFMVELILKGVQVVGKQCFPYCSFLEYVLFGPNLQSIGMSTFMSDKQLKKVRFEGTTPPSVESSDWFNSVPTTCIISVPYSSDHSVLAAYQAETNFPDPATYTYIEE